MAARLFGTDGVRGVANGDVLSPEVALALGRASALFARERGRRPARRRRRARHAPLGPDARGRAVRRHRVRRRPGAARRRAADARHRLARARAGREPRRRHLGLAQPVPRQRHQALRRRRLQARRRGRGSRRGAHERRERSADGRRGGRVAPLDGAAERYAAWVAGGGGTPIEVPSLRVLVDCAHGAASTVAPLVFAQLGIEHEITAAEPDGVNINDRVGSTHLDALASGVRAGGFDLGLAFDGDADRMLAVDADGHGRRRRPDHRAARARPADRRAPGGRQGRRHVDVESRLPPRDARARHRDRRDRRRRPLRARGHARARRRARAASSPGT